MPLEKSGKSHIFYYKGRALGALDEVIAWLETIADPRDRFRTQETIARHAFQNLSKDVDTFERYMSYLEKDTVAYQSVLETYSAFERTFQDELSWAREIRKERDRRQEAIKSIKSTWYHEPTALAWLDWLETKSSIRFSKTFFDRLRALSRTVRDWPSARQRINTSVQLRLSCRKKGIRYSKDITSSDLNNARFGKFQRTLLSSAISPDEFWLNRHEMHFDQFGLLASNSRTEWTPIDERRETIDYGLQTQDNAINPTFQAHDVRDVIPSPPLSDPGDASQKKDIDEEELLPDEETSMPVTDWTTGWKRCGCSADVPDKFLHKISRVSSLPMRERLNVLAEYVKFELPCTHHNKRFAVGLGLHVSRIKNSNLREKLLDVWEKRELVAAIEDEARTLRLFRREELFSIMYDDEN
ncbi:hypothetical protein F5Y16DRAFT_388371 [Xylariaceae sp. FL0255]|nr:hypothetical protein F5Y16DRAFT_388371 [Xylariaceae sp. FL0255]